MKLQQRLQQQLNKSIIIFLIVCLSFFNINDVLAANTHSIDLELSSSQYLSIADASQTGLDLSTDFTIEAWIKLEQLPSTAGTTFSIITKDADASRGYYFFITTDDKLLMDWLNNDPLQLNRRISDNAVFVSGDVGNWVHIAVAVDISIPSAVIYKNGSAVDSTQTFSQSTAMDGSTADVNIGRYSKTGANFFDGLIDEVRVYNDIRTPTEISTNYQQEIPADTQGLVGYWKLNNSLLDETANNNDLTNNNSAVFSSSVPFTGAVEFIPQILIY